MVVWGFQVYRVCFEVSIFLNIKIRLRKVRGILQFYKKDTTGHKNINEELANR